MRYLPLIFAAALISAPVHAPAWAEENDISEGMDLLSQGTQLLLRGLMTEIEPTLRDLEGALSEFDGMLGEFGAYHPPEILPNGDILIRRKAPRTKPVAPDTGEIDL